MLRHRRLLSSAFYYAIAFISTRIKLPPKTTTQLPQRNHDMSPTNNSRAWSYNPVPASVSNFELSAMIVRLIIIEMGHGTDCERQLVNASNGQMKANWWRQYLYPQQTLNVCSHLSIPDTSLPRGFLLLIIQCKSPLPDPNQGAFY